MIKIKKFKEELSPEEQKEILDIEQEIAELKKQKIDAETSEEKESIADDIDELKQQISDIKEV